MSTHSNTKDTSSALQYSFIFSRFSGSTFLPTISWNHLAYWLSMVDLLAMNSVSPYSS